MAESSERSDTNSSDATIDIHSQIVATRESAIPIESRADASGCAMIFGALALTAVGTAALLRILQRAIAES